MFQAFSNLRLGRCIGIGVHVGLVQDGLQFVFLVGQLVLELGKALA